MAVKKQLILILLTIIPMMVSADITEIEGIYYNLDKNTKSAEVISKLVGEYSSNVVIPNNVTYKDITYSVTSIGYRAFYECMSLTSITIPNSVTTIGLSAFRGCTGLTSITIGNSLNSIGEKAFMNCISLTSVHIADLAAWCGISFNDSFSNPLSAAHHLYLNGEEIKDLVIPESVTSIGKFAFYGCSSLTSITIPNNVTSIGESAFEECSGLTSIDIPNSVTSIGEWAFNRCSGLTSINIPNSVNTIGGSAFSECSGLTSINIPNSVTSIGSGAFQYCSNLTSITIPNSVTSIGKFAFWHCSSLTSITIPESVTSIGDYTFSSCSGLTSVTIPESVTSIGNYAFNNCSSLTSVTIPSCVTSIGDYTFNGCSGLKSIIIPENVTSIGSNAFMNCTALTSVTVNATNPPSIVGKVFGDLTNGIIFVPKESYNDYLNSWSTYSSNIRAILSEDDYTWESETSTLTVKSIYGIYAIRDYNSICEYFVVKDNVEVAIPSNAFKGNTSLQSISLGNNVTKILGGAFSGCSALTSFTIPSSVTSIDYEAFSGCTALTSVTANATTPPSIVGKVFGDLTNGIIFVPKESYNDYLNSWSTYSSKIRPILSEDDYRWESETSTLTVKSVYGIYAIRDYESSCVHFIINDHVEVAIPRNAFKGNTSLQSISLGNNVTSIGGYAFYECTSLTSVNIPNSVKTIGGSAFSECTGLTSINIGTSVTSIGYRAFFGCYGLTSITIPKSVTSIGNNTFSGCTALTSVTINATTPPSIGNDVFGTFTGGIIFVPKESYNAYLNAWSTYSSNIRAILSEDDYTWESESSTLTVKSIYGIYAIRDYRSSCVHFIINDDVEVEIPRDAFKGNTSLQSVSLGNNVTSIGGDAFFGCTELTFIIIPKSVKSIESGAFTGCSSMNSVVLNSNTLASNNYTSISNLNHIFGSQVTSYTFGEDITAIGSYAFYQNTNITAITFPDAVTSIGEHAFDGCNGLKTISIGSGIEAVGEEAFANCKKIEDVYCYAIRYPQTSPDAFKNSYPDYIVLHVPNESIKQYKAQSPWSSFKDVVGLGELVGISPILAQQIFIKTYGSIITIERAADGEEIIVYNINGVEQGKGVTLGGSATINTKLTTGSVAIVKIGKKSIKVVMK